MLLTNTNRHIKLIFASQINDKLIAQISYKPDVVHTFKNLDVKVFILHIQQKF